MALHPPHDPLQEDEEVRASRRWLDLGQLSSIRPDRPRTYLSRACEARRPRPRRDGRGCGTQPWSQGSGVACRNPCHPGPHRHPESGRSAGSFPKPLAGPSFHDLPGNDRIRILVQRLESAIELGLQFLGQSRLMAIIGESVPDLLDQAEALLQPARIELRQVPLGDPYATPPRHRRAEGRAGCAGRAGTNEKIRCPPALEGPHHASAADTHLPAGISRSR